MRFGRDRRPRVVSVYGLDGRILLQASAEDPDGLWLASGDVVAVPDGASPQEVGAVLARLLEQSVQLSVPSGTEGTDDLLAAAGTKTFRALVKAARHVLIWQEGKGAPVELSPGTPHVRGGSWITAGPDESIRADPASIDALGAAVLRALEEATTMPTG